MADEANAFDWQSLLPALITGILGIIGVALSIFSPIGTIIDQIKKKSTVCDWNAFISLCTEK